MEGVMSCKNLPFNLEWLHKEAVGFSLHGDQVTVLFTPDQFYSAIIDGCCRARHRVTLAALYIGMSSLEQKLVEVLDQRLAEFEEDLKVTVLLDAVRDSRDHSARTMLLPLLQKHPQCQVSLYRTPDLREIWSWIFPAKVTELVGIQHIKLYVFDNDVIITGANMTKEYFTTRQDRYVLVSDCQPLADFCSGLVDQICSVSLRLTDQNSLERPLTFPPSGQYVKHAHDLIWGYYKKEFKQSDKKLKPGDDTWLFPLIQLPPISVVQDSSITKSLLESLDSNITVHFACPYFNFPDEYIASVLQNCKTAFNILIPHPTANDFYGATGFAGQIPWLYSTMAASFLQRVEDTNQGERFTIKEFVRPGNSFHSKGFWCTAPGEECPFMTIVGSSNFNCRSVMRDLECQFVMVTSNGNLRQKLLEEKQRLFRHGLPFTQDVVSKPDRKPKIWHYLFLWFVRSFF